MGLADETRPPELFNRTWYDGSRSPSIPSKTESATPCDEAGQNSLTDVASAITSHKHIEDVTRQNMASEDGGNATLPTTDTRRSSGVLSVNTFNQKEREVIREEIMGEIDRRSLGSVDHVANGSFNLEDERREGPTSMLPHWTPHSSHGAQRVDTRRPQRYGTWPSDFRQRPETGTELGVIAAGPSQAGPSLPSSSLEPLSRQNSSTTSTKSAEWDPVLDVGFNDKNGKKQWRILSLDTNSDVNIVAQIVVDQLGLADQIEDYNGKGIKGLGRYAHVKPVGQIELTFSVVGGRKTLKKTFLVLSNEDADEFDAIGGLPLVKKEKWLRRGKSAAFMACSR